METSAPPTCLLLGCHCHPLPLLLLFLPRDLGILGVVCGYMSVCVCVLFELFSVYDSVCGYMSVICYVSVGILYEHMLYGFYECTCQNECGTLQGSPMPV